MALLTFSRERASNATLAAVNVTGFLMGGFNNFEICFLIPNSLDSAWELRTGLRDAENYPGHGKLGERSDKKENQNRFLPRP
jgi:hypothetical protein